MQNKVSMQNKVCLQNKVGGPPLTALVPFAVNEESLTWITQITQMKRDKRTACPSLSFVIDVIDVHSSRRAGLMPFGWRVSG
jgi:hypothetical protein